MTSEQPLKKKLRRGDDTDHTDETDFIHNLAENGMPTGLQALHLSLPANVNEDDITINRNGLRSNCQNTRPTNHDRYMSAESDSQDIEVKEESGLDDFQHHLIKQCLCSISEATIRKPFEGQQINDSSAARVLSSFLIIAKTNINNEWLETIVNFLTTENIDYVKMNFALEVVKRVVEWKDIEIHVLEDAESPDMAAILRAMIHRL
ncbi:hypothetical protein NQ318_012814 [Aromia moschata]|uniref:Uncharacterized protein n=1 Tax=Aromia moschata TaxID=1265417 RepID=A0AAV8XEK1_9CUCU|nr:hypothetical protein NQ318_012814 [Aromia moschata]